MVVGWGVAVGGTVIGGASVAVAVIVGSSRVGVLVNVAVGVFDPSGVPDASGVADEVGEAVCMGMALPVVVTVADGVVVPVTVSWLGALAMLMLDTVLVQPFASVMITV